MIVYFYVLIVLKQICFSNEYQQLNVSGMCGFPGEPPSAQHDMDERFSFNEGDKITYQCVDFLSYKQIRTCQNGKWAGPAARCGRGLNNDVNKIQVTDCASSPTRLLVNYSDVKQDKNIDRFPNSFSYERYLKEPIRATNSTCYRWSLSVTEKSYFTFVRIDFAIVFKSVAKANTEMLMVNATVGNSICHLVAQKRYKHVFTNAWIIYSHKYHYYFMCATGKVEESKLPKLFTIETESRNSLTIDLIRFAMGEVYGSVNDPACGVPEVPLGMTASAIREQQLYELTCDEPSYTNSTSTTFTTLTCMADASWHGEYPQCKPRNSCENSTSIKKLNQSLIASIKNVYYINESFWYAIEATQINYECRGTHFNMFGTNSRTCLSSGSWSIKQTPSCELNTSYYEPNTLNSSQNWNKIFYFLPFYIIAGVTSLVIVIILVFILLYLKKKSHERQLNQCESLPPESCSTDFSHLDDPQSIYYFHYQNQVQNEPIYDVPPSQHKPFIVYEYRKEAPQEPIYDRPKIHNKELHLQ